MSSFVRTLFVAFLMVIGAVRPAFAMGGGGPRVSTMSESYCRDTVYRRGVREVTRFEQEVRKCVANPVTYPTTAYK